MSLANSWAAGSTSAAGRARETRPISAASAPLKMRPLSSSSMARETPISRGSSQVEEASGTIPRRVKTNPYLASAAANLTSHPIGRVSPMPTADPFIAAMTGVRIRAGSMRTGSAAVCSASAGRLKVSPPRSRSAPAEKYRPAPVTTIARTWSSDSYSANASCSSRVITGENALRRSGRLSQIVATRPETSVSRVWKLVIGYLAFPLPRIPAQHEHPGGGEHAAVAEDDADLRVARLGGGLAAQLPDAFLDGEHAVHPGVRVGKAAAVRVQREPAARFGVPVGNEGARLALADEAERLQPVDGHMGERVVDHEVVDVGGADPRLGERRPARQPERPGLGEVGHLRDHRGLRRFSRAEDMHGGLGELRGAVCRGDHQRAAAIGDQAAFQEVERIGDH